MEANEFRKGIWVYGKLSHGKCSPPELIPLKITEDILEVLFASRNYDDFIGIPLTPKILERCKLKYIKYYFDNIGLKFLLGNEQFFHIQYLHQLQNFFFVLYNEELEVNLHAAKEGVHTP